jgi:hypothetical protein
MLVLSCLFSIQAANASGGSVDSSFGSSGYLVVDTDNTANTYEVILDSASQGEKLILAGERGGELYVARLTSLGQLDTTFGGQSTGYVTLGSFLRADKIAILNDGSFFVLGSFNSGGRTNSVLLKFTANGVIDGAFNQTSFNSTLNSSFTDFSSKDVALSPSQDIVYVLLYGNNSSTNASSPLLYKFSVSGALDSTFATNFTTASAYGPQYPTAMATFGDYIYVAGYRDYRTNFQDYTIGQVAKFNSNGNRDNTFPSPNANYRPSFVSLNPAYNASGRPYDEVISDVKITSSGDLYVTGVFYAPPVVVNGSYTFEESEFFVKKINSFGSEQLSKVIFQENYTSNGYLPALELYSDNKVLITLPYATADLLTSFTRVLRLTPTLTTDDFGIAGSTDLPNTYSFQSLLLHANQRIVLAGGYGDLNANGYVVAQYLSFDPPNSPTIGTATATGSTTATVSFTAPASNGGATITGYTATSSPGGFTGTLSGSTAGSITVSGLSASTSYTFTVTATNSDGTSSASAASNSITTSASNGGTGGGGTTTSTTAADELRRQQEAAQAAKQKQDQELKEILSLVPSIAGLAQGIAGLGNSLLLPKKCVKGKLVKNVKAGAKCPKGYTVRK